MGLYEGQRTGIRDEIEDSIHPSKSRGDDRLGQRIFDVGAHSTTRNPTNPICGLRGYIQRMARQRMQAGDTFSRSAAESFPTESAEEKDRWVTLISGMMSCLDRMSADSLGPTANVSHRHRNVSFLSSNARSWNVWST